MKFSTERLNKHNTNLLKISETVIYQGFEIYRKSILDCRIKSPAYFNIH